MTAASPTWFGRNWKWFIPVGCLTVLLLVAAAAAALIFGITGIIRKAEPYQHGLELAQANTAVTQRLGTPIEAGLTVMGSINIEGDDGTANISFPISGPKGEGKVFVSARKVRGDWIYDVVEADTGPEPRIDLLAGADPARLPADAVDDDAGKIEAAAPAPPAETPAEPAQQADGEKNAAAPEDAATRTP